jgi:uncharacterized protein YcfL
MKRLFSLAALSGALLLTACATADSKLINYRGDNLKGTIILDKSVVVLTEGGLPQAKAILKNDVNSTTKFEYKFLWLDENDMPIDEDSRPWRPASVPPNDQLTVSGTGPNNHAKKFQIQIREPQGVTK